MRSKASVASATVRTGAWTGCVEWSASSASADALPRSNSSQTRHSGRQSSTTRKAIQVAKASLSQRSSHQVMVTRLPNHWWASSCVTTSAMRLRCASDAVAGSSSSATSR